MNTPYVTVTLFSGNKRYSEDLSLNELLEDNELMEDECRSLPKFSVDDIGNYNGNHFVFGWFESFCQSDFVAFISNSVASELEIEVTQTVVETT